MDMNTLQLKTVIEQYNSAGWYAHHYPRKRMVSLNGHKAISEQDALDKMTNSLQQHTLSEGE